MKDTVDKSCTLRLVNISTALTCGKTGFSTSNLSSPYALVQRVVQIQRWSALGLHPSGESLLVGDSNGTVTIFDSTSFHVKAQLGGVHSSIVTSLSIGSPDNHDNCHVFSGAFDCSLVNGT